MPDAGESPFFRQPEWGQWRGSIISIPLKYGGEVVGVMNVAWPHPHGYNETMLRLLRLFADHAAIAIHNAFLFQEAQQKSEKLGALYQMAHTLSTSLDLREALQQVATTAQQILPAATVMLFLADPSSPKKWCCQVALGEHARPLVNRCVELKEGVLAEALASGQTLLIPHMEPESLWQGAGEALAGLRQRSLLVAPLSVQGERLGLLVAFSHSPTASFGPEEKELISTLADHAAIALRNAMLVDHLRTQVQDMAAVARLSAALRRAPASHSIAEILVREACQLVQASQGAILLAVRESQEPTAAQRLVVESLYGLSHASLGRFSFLPPEEPVARLLRHTSPVSLADLPPTAYRPLLHLVKEWQHFQGPMVCAPLHTVAGQALGLLLVARTTDRPFTPKDLDLLQTATEIGANALQRAQAYESLEETFLQTVLALSQAVDAKDAYTGDHSAQLAEWAVAVGDILGLSEAEKQHLHWAALLHDIGKIGVPDEILLKPGPLTPEEWAVMKRHPEIGANIIRRVQRLEPIAAIIAAHHERWDGSGYPKGLKGEEIPLGARILAVVDSYSAMVDDRIYRRAIPHEKAIEIIRRNAGKLYDPRVVEAFLKVVEEGFSPLPERPSPKPPNLVPPPDPAYPDFKSGLPPLEGG